MTSVSTDPAAEAAGLLLRTCPPMVMLRPGDKVLVAFTDDPDPATIQQIASSLRKSFPGVDFTVLTGVASIAVQGEVSFPWRELGSTRPTPGSGKC